MLENNTGHIVGVNGNMLTVEFETAVTQNEVAFAVLGDIRLKAEVIRVRGRAPTFRFTRIPQDSKSATPSSSPTIFSASSSAPDF